MVPRSAGVIQVTSLSTSPTTVISNGYGSLATTNLQVNDPAPSSSASVTLEGIYSGNSLG